MIGEATRTIVEGRSQPVSVMQLRSEGNTIYALQQASWGVLKDAYKKKDRFYHIKLFCYAYHFAPTKVSG